MKYRPYIAWGRRQFRIGFTWLDEGVGPFPIRRYRFIAIEVQ